MTLILLVGSIVVLGIAAVIFSIVTKGNQNIEDTDLGQCLNYSVKVLYQLNLLRKFYHKNPGLERVNFNKLRRVMYEVHHLNYYQDYLIVEVGESRIGIFAISLRAQRTLGGKLYRYSDFHNVTYDTIATLS